MPDQPEPHNPTTWATILKLHELSGRIPPELWDNDFPPLLEEPVNDPTWELAKRLVERSRLSLRTGSGEGTPSPD
jgi:hypothetical protein